MPCATSEMDLIYRIAGHLADGDTLDEELSSVVEFAGTLTGCDECCTFVREGNFLLPWVWKHVERGSLDRVPVTVDGGFAASLSRHCAPVAVVPGLAGSGFRGFRDWPTDSGVSLVAVPLLWRSSLMGAITMYHTQPRAYKRSEVRMLSSVGFILGAELRMLELQKHNLQLVLELETRKLVERSKGILQRELGLTAHEAYLALQRQSHEKNRPMKDIAQAIILSSEVKHNAAQAH